MKKQLCAITVALCGIAAFTGCSGSGTAYGLTRKQYSEIYGKVSSVIFDGDETAERTVGTVRYEENQDFSTVRSTGAFVYFLKEIYKNDKFRLSEDPVTFTCSYANWDQECTVTMLSTYDKELGAITGEMFVKETYRGQSIPDGYINVKVEYDFDNETLLGFTLAVCDWEGGDSAYYTYDKYTDGRLYSLSSDKDEDRENAILEMESSKAGYAEKMKNAKTLKTDFTEEYTRSMSLVDI